MTIITNQVRKARPEDEDELMEMCRSLHKENGLFPMDEGRVRAALRKAFNEEGAVIGVVGDRGKIEGSIYLMISNFWYSTEFHLEELWNYVLPEYRRSQNAKNLIEFAKRCSDEADLTLVIGVVSNEDTARKIAMYRRRLKEPTGAFWVHHPSTRRREQAERHAAG
jgi:hypothetical protein